MEDLTLLVCPGGKSSFSINCCMSSASERIEEMPSSRTSTHRNAPSARAGRIAEDNRDGCPQLMGRIRNKPLLLPESCLQTFQHMIECIRQFRELIADRRHRNPAIHLLNLNLPGCCCHIRPDRLQNTFADKIASSQCQHESQYRHQEQDLLQCFQNAFQRLWS